MMKRIVFILLLSFFCSLIFVEKSYSQQKIIQLYGVVRGTDSSDVLPGASVYVKGTSRGTIANDNGIFSIAVSPGDKIEFSFIGFKNQTVQIPANLREDAINISPVLVEDTAYLPTAIVSPLLLPALFKIMFLREDGSNDRYATALANVNVKNMLREMRFYKPSTPGAINMMHQQQSILQGSQKGLIPSTGIINPYSWYDFIKSLKQGD